MTMAAVKYPHIGPHGLKLLRAAIDGGSVRVTSKGEAKAATGLNGNNRYLDRDPKDGALWYPTDHGRAALADMDAKAAAGEANSPAVSANEQAGLFANLTAIANAIDLARRRFNEGDVATAHKIANGAYDFSKTTAKVAADSGLDFGWVTKSHEMMGDALRIDVLCKMQLARAFNAAQADGKALKGRRKSIDNENTFTLAEAGLTASEIHSARAILDEEEKNPGFAERAIAARLAAGLAPNKRSLKNAIGTKTATKEERGHNLYETGPEAVHMLLALEDFSATIWEPACGRGAISRMLEAAGYDVEISDLIDYGTADRNGELQTVVDFLATEGAAEGESGSYDIVTNPPFGDVLNAFVAHALRVHRPRKMALLMNLNYLCGSDEDRKFARDIQRPSRIYINAHRLPTMHRDGWDGNLASSSMNTAWYVWERGEDGNYSSTTTVQSLDWRDYMPGAAVAESRTRHCVEKTDQRRRQCTGRMAVAAGGLFGLGNGVTR